jgi:hypothetical protein
LPPQPYTVVADAAREKYCGEGGAAEATDPWSGITMALCLRKHMFTTNTAGRCSRSYRSMDWSLMSRSNRRSSWLEPECQEVRVLQKGGVVDREQINEEQVNG